MGDTAYQLPLLSPGPALPQSGERRARLESVTDLADGMRSAHLLVRDAYRESRC